MEQLAAILDPERFPYPFLDQVYFGNDVRTYLTAVIVLIGFYILFRFILFLILKSLRNQSKKTNTTLDDALVEVLEKSRWVAFLLIIIVYIDVAFQFLPQTEAIFDGVFNIVVVFAIVRVINFVIAYIAERIIRKKQEATEEFSIRFISKSCRALTWVFGGLFLISSFGYDISSLVAGLGIGGVAVALAVQSILSDLISSISIQLDKPFKVGDFIQVGPQMGTVKYIGLKTTRITSFEGEEIVMSNKQLTESTINNYGKLKRRRYRDTIGVEYGTSLAKMKKIPEAIKKIIDKVPDTTFDRAHFKNFGDSAKQFEVVYYVDSKEFVTHLDRRQEINLEIQKFFEKNKIEFAFPSRTVYLKK